MTRKTEPQVSASEDPTEETVGERESQTSDEESVMTDTNKPKPVNEPTEDWDPNQFLDELDEEREELDEWRESAATRLGQIFYERHARLSRYNRLNEAGYADALESLGEEMSEILNEAKKIGERGNVLSAAYGTHVAAILQAVNARLSEEEWGELSEEEQIEHYREASRSSVERVVFTDNPPSDRFYLYNPRQKRADGNGYHSASHLLLEVYEWRGEVWVRPVSIAGSLREPLLNPIQEKRGYVSFEAFRKALQTGEAELRDYVPDQEKFHKLRQLLKFSIRAWQFANGELDLEEEDQQITERAKERQAKREELREKRRERAENLSVTADRVDRLMGGKQIRGVAGFIPWNDGTAFIDVEGTEDGVRVKELTSREVLEPGVYDLGNNRLWAALCNLRDELSEDEN